MKVFFFIVAVLLVSCTFEPQKAYLLTPTGPAPSRGGTAIGIGPITVADYLQRLEIPVQTAGNELEYAFENLWAGTVESQLLGVVSANVGRRVGTGALYQYPWPASAPLDFQVEVEMRRLHSTENGEVLIDASWQLYRLTGKTRKAVTSRSFTRVLPFEGVGFQPAIAAKSRAVDLLCAEIAGVIRGMR